MATVSSVPPYPRRMAPLARRSREFTPEELKDAVYWERRRRNNEAARRSRQKRRRRELVLEQRLLELLEENCRLRAHLVALRLPSAPRSDKQPDTGATQQARNSGEPAWLRSLPHKLRLKISSPGGRNVSLQGSQSGFAQDAQHSSRTEPHC
ncbi:hypothetical protein chiPu_0017348 [Chiloscyllium punctatum]|uniref:BZIP domain-containing protein n=1 Tax=Chiloscyllium punctatum TaxID=137246 RepID=A0A401RF68_CHIPU|nr:hypothetical protein [Chiloscyllium punctatum]